MKSGGQGTPLSAERVLEASLPSDVLQPRSCMVFLGAKRKPSIQQRIDVTTAGSTSPCLEPGIWLSEVDRNPPKGRSVPAPRRHCLTNGGIAFTETVLPLPSRLGSG